eukprot:MONOS_4410.1-p1 / transcript=MONOS_4410.1 / gene=MONOS_4410 / organism=Monocercomonoides_exilis_PA203 / gene_product=unspecified product / transcript_product=unspecified product / location=Mono_scaffold00117:50578-51988(+) / protein_length=403 / sequence_SO=supercontig / SO=protein_coding / is_pseudo=false
MTRTEQFSILFHEQEDCREVEQMQKIEEMNGLIDEMNEIEFKSIFTKELFDKIYRMIEKKILSLESAILLLKHVGYFRELKTIYLESIDYSLLSERMKEMMIDENEKKKERNEKILTDICECYALLIEVSIPKKLLSIVVPCLLKVALKKDETDEAQKEVEMSLPALGNIGFWEIEQKLYLNEIKEIIEYHQEHQNLTRLAYQSAWQFLMNRFYNDRTLEEVITNELHFSKEAKELKDLSKYVDWKRKEERKGEREAKEVLAIWRWFFVIDNYFCFCKLWNEELVGLINSFAQMLRASRDNYPDISHQCLYSLRSAAEKRNVEIDNFLKSGTIDAVLEEIQQPTINDDIMWNGLLFFLIISERLKEEDEESEVKRNATKMKIFEKMEEEGYEDFIESFREMK